MQRKIYYTNNREQLIEDAAAQGQRLKEDAITFDEGKYLIFTDDPLPQEPPTQQEYITEIENKVLILQNEITGGIL